MNKIMKATKSTRHIIYEELKKEVEIADFIIELSSVAVIRMLVELGKISPYISRNEANKLYGKSLVDLWFSSGILKVIKNGEGTSKYRLDRVQLEALGRTNCMSEWCDRKAKEKSQKLLQNKP
jgi:hypothetical protein